MKIRLNHLFPTVALLALMGLDSLTTSARAQGTAFTYQGQLQNNGSPANGTYNFAFSLYNAPTGGTQVGSTFTTNGVHVTDGLFTVTIDFTASPWNGATNWLQVEVETNTGNTFTLLAPLQQMTPVPYAIYAENAQYAQTTTNLIGTFSASQLTSTGNNNGGAYNFFVGLAGNPTTSGSDNTANGNSALVANTTGLWNTANGANSLSANTSGQNNTATGGQALQDNTTGNNNTATGIAALYYNLTGTYNTADGAFSLNRNTSGIYNTATGGQALYSNTTGDNNTANGYNSLNANTTGIWNTASGVNSLSANTTGNNNTAIGGQALQDNTTGANNTATGIAALFSNTTGSYNSADGAFSLNLNTTGSNNTATGAQALYSNTTGSNNTAAGVNTLYGNQSGSYNTAGGYQALYFNTTGNDNTALGYDALKANVTGANNVAIGGHAAGNTTNDNNIVAVGYQALALENAEFTDTLSGNGENTAIGYQALYQDTSGAANSALGYQSLNMVTTGSYNAAIGDYALQTITTGSGNIGIGALAGQNFAGSESYNIDIGNGGVTGESGIIRIGSPLQTATYLTGMVYSTGFQSTSDRNAKENFAAVDPLDVLNKVAALPVTKWNYKTDKKSEHIGPVAQDFHSAFEVNGDDDTHISMVDESGVALAAIQGLNQKLEQQAMNKDAEIADLRRQNGLLANQLEKLASAIEKLEEKNLEAK